MKRVFYSTKIFFDIISFCILGGSSLVIVSAMFVEMIYSKIFSEYWIVWWRGWLIIALMWALIDKRKTVRERRGVYIQGYRQGHKAN